MDMWALNLGKGLGLKIINHLELSAIGWYWYPWDHEGMQEESRPGQGKGANLSPGVFNIYK